MTQILVGQDHAIVSVYSETASAADDESGAKVLDVAQENEQLKSSRFQMVIGHLFLPFQTKHNHHTRQE